MKNPWFRLHAEFATDPKIQIMSETLQRRFVMLLCLRCNDDLAKLSDDELCFTLRISKNELIETKSVFIEKGFIDDNWEVLNWDKRQYKSDNSTERSRRYRDKLKSSKKEDVDATLHGRDGNVNAAPPDTDTDTDTDTDKKTMSVSPKPDHVLEIFEFWKSETNSPKSKLDDKRRKIIKTALKIYDSETLKNAIMGCMKTPHNIGQNDRNEKYLGLHIIFRNADQIDRFVSNYFNPPNNKKSKPESQQSAIDDFIGNVNFIEGSLSHE